LYSLTKKRVYVLYTVIKSNKQYTDSIFNFLLNRKKLEHQLLLPRFESINMRLHNQ